LDFGGERRTGNNQESTSPSEGVLGRRKRGDDATCEMGEAKRKESVGGGGWGGGGGG